MTAVRNKFDALLLDDEQDENVAAPKATPAAQQPKDNAKVKKMDKKPTDKDTKPSDKGQGKPLAEKQANAGRTPQSNKPADSSARQNSASQGKFGQQPSNAPQNRNSANNFGNQKQNASSGFGGGFGGGNSGGFGGGNSGGFGGGNSGGTGGGNSGGFGSGFGGGNFQSNNNNEYREKRHNFDRKSGSDKTGVKHFDKRDGKGPGNWGSNDGAEVIKDEAAIKEDKDKENQDDRAENAEVAKMEEEPKVMSIQEFRAEQRKNAARGHQAQARKPNEGENAFNDEKLVKIVPDDHKEAVKRDHEMATMSIGSKSGRVKQRIDVQFKPLADQSGRGRGRGGRGGGRGGDSRGGGRNFPKQQGGAAPKYENKNQKDFHLDDEAFPTLG